MMKCIKCDGSLEKKNYKKIELDQCNLCEGMWLDANELDALEDIVDDLDESKGTMVFHEKNTQYKCPHCGTLLKKFDYRLYDLVLELCEKHGYWLDKGEEERVLELMQKEKANLERKILAEEEWEHAAEEKSF